MDYITRPLDYAAHTEDNLYNARYERPGILSMLPTDLHGLRALDAGCGAGHHSAELAARGAQVTALDLGPGMVEITQKRLGTEHDVFCADLSQPLNTLQDNTFHIILSSLTLHYIKDLRIPFSEFARVSTPNAQLVFSMHHPCTTIQYFPRENYFEQVLIKDAWDIQGTPFHVSYWARPLSKILRELHVSGWSRFQIHEPQPDAPYDPERTKNLWTRPQFLFVSAQK